MAEKPRVFHASPDGTAEPAAAAAPNTGGPSGTAEPDLKSRTLAEMSFSTHVLSLNAMAQMQLGALDPGAHGVEAVPVDLEGASHLIDTLAMLRDKTRNNLTPAEQKLLDAVLYDLRMKFVAARG